MAHRPSSKKRLSGPASFRVGSVRVRPMKERGTHPDDPDVCYWRGERKDPAGKWKAVWTGWRTREQAEKEVAALVATGESEAYAAHQGRPTGAVLTVGDLLDRWLSTVELRGRRGTIAREQKERRYENGLPDTDPSRGRAKARTMGESDSRVLGVRSVEKYKTAARAIKRSPLGQARLLDVGRQPKILAEYTDARQTANPATGRKAVAPATVAMELTVLKAAWTWGSKAGRAYTSGLKLVLPYLEIHGVRDQATPSSEALDRVVATLPDTPAGGMVRAQRLLGCRIEALERLLVRDVDLGTRRIRLFAKNHDRIISMPPGLEGLLESLLSGRHADARVFDGASRASFQGAIDRAVRALGGADDAVRAVGCPACGAGAGEPCTGQGGGHAGRGGQVRFHSPRRKKAGTVDSSKPRGPIRRFTSHGIRRRRSQEAREAGIPLHVYMRIFGHTAEEALRAYGQPTIEDEEAAWKATDACPAGDSESVLAPI